MKTADLKLDERYWVRSNGETMVVSTERWYQTHIGGNTQLHRAESRTVHWRKPGLPVIGFGAWGATGEEQARLFAERRAQLPEVAARFREQMVSGQDVPELPKGFFLAIVQPQTIISTMAQREADEKVWREQAVKDNRAREEREAASDAARQRVRSVLGEDFYMPQQGDWVTMERVLRRYAERVQEGQRVD